MPYIHLKRAAVRILGVLLAAALVAAPAAMPASADDSMQSLKNKLSALEQQEKQIDAQKQQNVNSQASNQASQKTLSASISVAEQKIDVLNLEIRTLNQKVSGKETDISEAQKTLQKDYDTFKQRLRAMYITGDTSFIDTILSSSSLTDFLMRRQIMRSITQYDSDMLQSIRNELNSINASKKQLESDRDDLTDTKAQMTATSKDLTQQLHEQQQEYQKLKSAASGLDEDSAAVAKQMEAANNAIASLAAVSHGSYAGGQMLWPIQGMGTYITDPFGPRINPVTHLASFHEGIDISGDSIYGHPISAANAGVVKAVEASSGAYGNYVIIDHGGGIMTFYGHCSAFGDIAVGQTVTRGETIAYVGSTGWSTGPHLHFGVLVNGSYVNPLNYSYAGR